MLKLIFIDLDAQEGQVNFNAWKQSLYSYNSKCVNIYNYIALQEKNLVYFVIHVSLHILRQYWSCCYVV